MSVADLGRVLVVIPTYNEAENLQPVVARLRASVPEADVLVVDDGSPDGTGDIADRLAAADPSVHVLHRTGRPAWARRTSPGSAGRWPTATTWWSRWTPTARTRPEELPRLLTALREADLVIGSRWVPGGQIRNWPLYRQIISIGGSTYARVLLRFPVRDSTSGYRAFRRQVLEELKLDEVASQGYCFQIDLAWKTWRSGFRVREVPITFTEREVGRSKMSRAIVLEALWRVAGWGLTSRSRSARARALAARR